MESLKSNYLTLKPLLNARLLSDVALIILGAYFITSAVIPDRMDGDIIVPSIAAFSNPTLFYWGQDRLLALTTFLLIPIRDIQISLFLNTFLQATYFCGLILLITKYTSGKHLSRSLGYCLAILALYWLIPHSELFTFAKHQQPYCVSTLAALLSYRTFENNRSTIQTKRLSILFISSFFSVIALLLNPLSLTLLITQPLSAWLVNRKYNTLHSHVNSLSIKHWLLSLSTVISSYLIIKNVYAQNYNIGSTSLEVSLSRIPNALKTVSESFRSSFNVNTLTLIIIIATILACLARFAVMLLTNGKLRPKAMNAQKQFYDHNFLFLAITLNLISLIPILSSHWLELNGYALRYLYPIYLLFFTTITITSCYLTNKLMAKNIAIIVILRSVTIGAVVAFFIGSLRPLPALTSYRQISAIVPAYNTINSSPNKNLLVAGSYWKIWPLKAYALKHGQNLPVLTDRSAFDPISRQASTELQSKVENRLPFSYLCIIDDTDLSPCRQYFLNQVFEKSNTSRQKNIISDGWFVDRELLNVYHLEGSSSIKLIRFDVNPSL